MLIPKEIQEKEFSMAVRGYNPQQVDGFLDYLVTEIEKLIEENNSLKSKGETVKTVDADSEKIKVALQNALLSAQLTAEDIKDKANLEAKRLIEEANSRAAILEQQISLERNRLDDEMKKLKAAKEEIGYKLRTLLNSYIKMLDSLELGSETIVQPGPSESDFENTEEEIQKGTGKDKKTVKSGEAAKSPNESQEVIANTRIEDSIVENPPETEEKGTEQIYTRRKNRINIAPDDLVNKFFGPETSV